MNIIVPTITVGELITALTLGVAIIGASFRMGGRLKSIETKLEPLWEWWNTRNQIQLEDNERVARAHRDMLKSALEAREK